MGVNVIISKDTIARKLSLFLNPLEKENITLIVNAINYLNDKSVGLLDFECDLNYEKNIYPHYNAIQKTIYVPTNLRTLPSHQMQDLNIHLKKYTVPFVVYHENAHAILDSLLYGMDPVLVKIGFLNSVPNTEELSLFLNGSKIKLHNGFEQFVYKNYQEAFCDCTAMYCLYKENKDINILDDIIKYRKKELVKHNIANPKQLSGYMNVVALEKFKNNIVKITNKPYKDIYFELNEIILTGLKEIIYNLAENNDLFLKGLSDVINKNDKIKDKSLVGFFEYFDNISSSFVKKDNSFDKRILLNKGLLRDVSNASHLELLQTDYYSRVCDVGLAHNRLIKMRNTDKKLKYINIPHGY